MATLRITAPVNISPVRLMNVCAIAGNGSTVRTIDGVSGKIAELYCQNDDHRDYIRGRVTEMVPAVSDIQDVNSFEVGRTYRQVSLGPSPVLWRVKKRNEKAVTFECICWASGQPPVRAKLAAAWPHNQAEIVTELAGLGWLSAANLHPLLEPRAPSPDFDPSQVEFYRNSSPLPANPVGIAAAPYALLVQTLGPPNPRNCGEWDGRWDVHDARGNTATIYGWLDPDARLGCNCTWNIDGNLTLVARLFPNSNIEAFRPQG